MHRIDRSIVYHAIDTERDYQDACRGNSARVNLEDNHGVGDFLVFLDEYLQRAKRAHCEPMSSTPAGTQKTMDVIRKVAGLCVNMMECHGAPKRS